MKTIEPETFSWDCECMLIGCRECEGHWVEMLDGWSPLIEDEDFHPPTLKDGNLLWVINELRKAKEFYEWHAKYGVHTGTMSLNEKKICKNYADRLTFAIEELQKYDEDL